MGRGASAALLVVGLLTAAVWTVEAQVLSGPSQLERCDEGAFALSFSNPDPTQTACQIVFQNTLPGGDLEYVPGSGSLSLPGTGAYPVDPSSGVVDVDAVVGAPYELPPGETATLEFLLATGCLAVSGVDSARIDYVNCTAPGTPASVSDSLAVEILPGAVTVAKSPANPPGGVGDLVTWTLEVRSTGLGSIKNVVATDTLGPGLEYVSSTPAGQAIGQVVTWDAGDIPALADMSPDATVSITLEARVVACSGLENEFDAQYGCAPGDVCGDTATHLGDCGSWTATSSVAFIERLPFLSFSAPTITIPYCAATADVSIPITNSGDGTAHEGTLCVSLSSLAVSNVGGGAAYDGACFHLPDIEAGATFTLTFDVTYDGDWCASAPSGSPLYTLQYENDCGVTHHAAPQFGSIGASAAPGLSLSKTGPDVVQFGTQVEYNISAAYSGPTSCGAGTTGLITVTDHLPAGFTVVDEDGGVWVPGSGGTGGTVTWTFDPTLAASSAWTLAVEVPLDCEYCYTEQTNTVEASATSCCGCDLAASSNATIAIECERLFTSESSLSPSATLERCGEPVTIVDSHTFADDPGLDGVTFGDFAYSFIKANGLAYVPDSAVATIDGDLASITVTDGAEELQIAVTDARSIRGHTLAFTYDVQATAESDPACGGASSFYVWASHEIPEVGPCTLFYDTALLTIQPPSMGASIAGVPTIQEDCATYPVTLTFRRTSSVATPYDARLVLSGTADVIGDFAAATWTGVTPSESPIVGADTVEWRFADGFSAAGATASATIPVTARCGGPSISLSVEGFYDDLCDDTDGYNDTCRTAAAAGASLRLTGDVYLSKTPEVIYTTERSVTWSLELYNASNGTAYNVYVDDVLGTGLVYSSSSVSGLTGTMTTAVDEDHAGAPINGVSFQIDHIDPGEHPSITLTADLVACSDMTNAATVGWGCGETACQTPRSDSSYVLTAPANVVATSIAPTPLDACATQQATITFRSAGIATAYNLQATATLPSGLLYAGNPEYRVGSSSWIPAGEPFGAPGPTLTWTSTQVPELAAVSPSVTVAIRFDVQPSCSFAGGTLKAQTSFENPCGQTLLSAIGTFQIASRTPALSLTIVQTSPSSGQPIACDGEATWEIRVTNSGPASAQAVWVEDALGSGLTYVSSTGGADGGWGSGQTATWEIENLAAGSTTVLTVTAEETDCGALTNAVKAYWACGPDGSSSTTPDCLSSAYASASASATRVVTLSASASLSPSSIGACDAGATFTLTLRNLSTSAPAYSADVRVTLPAGLSYRTGSTEVDCGSGFAAAPDPLEAGQVLTWYDTAGMGPESDLCTTIDAGATVAVRFQVDAACYRTSGAATIDTYYYDCCAASQYHGTTTSLLTAAPPTLSLSVSPTSAALDCADLASTVTWTITVLNTGSSAAEFVRVIDTLGADLVHVSGGTQIGADPRQWGWELGPIAAGGSETVELVARLAAPPDDCSVTRRTSTAVATWGCTDLPLDGDPNTTDEYACTSSGSPVTRTATVAVPDLSLSASDLNPQFTCSSDGISNGRLLLTVRNSGTAPVSTNFSIAFSESTTGWSSGGTFTSLGGTLPLAAGGSQTLTLGGWPIACSSCSYTFAASLDTGDTVCECRENNNTATLSYTPTSPDLTVASSTLAPTCAGDGQVRVQGSVTLRNTGCGSGAFTASVPMRFTVYAGDACSGTVLDQWTQTFTGVSLVAGGGTQAFAVDRTATYGACSECELSILIEADYSNAICECSGTNNTLCAGPLAVAFPDLIVSGIDASGLSCGTDAVTGSVIVRVTNQGCGAAGAFSVGLSTSGCLTFSTRRVTGLAGEASVDVSFPVSSTWSACGTCDCTFTATVDTGGEVCECDGSNNTGTATYASPLPDLAITALSASAVGPCLPGSAVVTVRNAGCGVAPSGVVVGITGAATGQAATTAPLAAGASETVTVPLDAAIGCGAGYSVTATVDPADAVCECTGTNNTAATTFSVSGPDLTVTNLATSCNLDDTFTVTADVRNLGGEPATSAGIRVYADGALIHSEAQTVAAGGTYALSYVTPPLLCATPHTIRIVADEQAEICECAEANNEATTAAALCPCPALSTTKSITNVWRHGTSLGAASAIEPGDVVEYTATVTNNGTAIAFRVDLTDALPAGLVYETDVPGHGGQYTLSTGGSGTFYVPVGATSFGTTVSATLASGQSLTIRYCAAAQSSLTADAILTNIAAGYGEEGNGDLIPSGAASATATGRRPGLGIEKTITDVLRNGSSMGASGPVEPGDEVAYEVVVRNIGGATAYSVELSDVLPTGLVYESVGSYSVSAPAASGSLGIVPGTDSFQTAISATLAGGATFTAEYRARAQSSISGAAPLANTASVAGRDGAGGAIPETEASIPDTFADQDSASVSSAKPALAVGKSVVDVLREGTSVGVVDPLLYGDVVVYEVTVWNIGSGTAYGADLAEALPSGMVVDTSTALGAGTYAVSGPSAAGALGLSDGASSFATGLDLTIAGGQTAVFRFAARATPNARPSVWLTNAATATGRDGSGTAVPEFDTAMGDTYPDTGTASVRVGAPALVTAKEIAELVRNGEPAAHTTLETGDVVIYALTVRNVGQAPAYAVSVRDDLPPGLTYRGASDASWPGGASTADPLGLPGQTLTWPLAATLGAGERLTLTFEAVALGAIDQGTIYTNTFTATGENSVGVPIPADSRTEVPTDVDADDSSSVGIAGAEAALVTQKRIADVLRNGRSLGPSMAIAAGDIVTFHLGVTNVGTGTAYSVELSDDLPDPFEYVSGTSFASWPSYPGALPLEPVGGSGQALLWATGADLPPGGALALWFQAVASGTLAPSSSYSNVLAATGLDGVRNPIPTSNPRIPADTDADDEDSVVLLASGASLPSPEVPALVTEKVVRSIRRLGVVVNDDRIEAGDVIDYEIAIRNVGVETAYAVSVTDELPSEFTYVSGSTTVELPRGFSFSDPRGSLQNLTFDPEAVLAGGEEMLIRLQAEVAGPLVDGQLYANRVQAAAVDRAGATVPADQHLAVPADTDADDASAVFLRGRSSVAEGAGGLVSVPILRKTAKTLPAAACRGLAAVADRVWFQTDIALFAASEFSTYAQGGAPGDAFPDTLLPTWTRTVRAELARYATENTLQVSVLTGLGVPLSQSPRLVAAADARQSTLLEATAQRLAELGGLAGLVPGTPVPDGRWVFLEAEAGEPVFRTERDTPWGESGTWTVVDEDLVASSLGMGLVRQAQASRELLGSSDARERYVGWVLAEIMAGKLAALNGDLVVHLEDSPDYVPHLTRSLGLPGAYEVTEGASVLFDQLSLLWGASRVLQLVNECRQDWPAAEDVLLAALEGGARALLARAAQSIVTYHTADDGRIVGRSPAVDGAWVDASTVDLGLLLLAIDEALPVAGSAEGSLRTVRSHAVSRLLRRQGADGRFTEVATTAGVSTDLTAQFAGLYALVTIGELAAAERTFDFLESRAWDEWKGFGLYRMPEDTDGSTCYTPLDMGLATGALRALSVEDATDRGPLAAARLASFVRTVLDDAALQLDNARDGSAPSIASGTTSGSVFALGVPDADRLAPVLQRSLCLQERDSDTACGRLRILPHEPWYQTDIAMYASSLLQSSGLGREDDADANLVAVDFHSRLGVPLAAYSDVAEIARQATRDAEATALLDPIVLPFYAGSPSVGDEGASGLAWNPSSFDERVVPSAIGMTLLREAQEVGQLAREAARSPEQELTARTLLSSVAGKVAILQSMAASGPSGAPYLAHAYGAQPATDGVALRVLDPTSDLFDQSALLLGLAGTVALAQDGAAATLFAALSIEPSLLGAQALALVEVVLDTLEDAHSRPREKVLAHSSTPEGSAWAPGFEVHAWSLGLVVKSLDAVVETLGQGAPLAVRAQRLLDAEVAFLRSSLWDGSGGYRDAWLCNTPDAAQGCEPPTLIGQLGALRALLVAHRRTASPVDEIRSAILSFDTRFWDPAAEMYVATLDRLTWCMTPLDLAYVVDVVPEALAFVGDSDAQRLQSHLARHVDRALDSVDLQIPPRSLDLDGRDRRFAPVLDRRICLEPVVPYGNLSWTAAGDLVRYTVEVENPTEETFTRLTVDDLLPEGVTLVATNPEAQVAGRSLRWTFDRLDPGEVRAWQIDARIAAGVPGDAFTNCATLKYTDAFGTERPTREACASVTLADADSAYAAALQNTSASYRTDQAMRLAVALDEAADLGLLGTEETDARGASLANLGVLLGESGLGVPFERAPIWNSPQDASDALAERANRAGLPGLPDLATPIFLPSVGGVPVLDRGSGFIEKKSNVSPASVGWTLAREASYLDRAGGSEGALTEYLMEVASLAVRAQLTWLGTFDEPAADAARFAHGIAPQVTESDVLYLANDPRSFAYDQASLLGGLVRTASSRGVSLESADLASTLAGFVLSDLARHVGADGVLLDTLDPGSPPAPWFDVCVAVRALSEATARTPKLAQPAKDLLRRIVRTAENSPQTDPSEEAARIDLILVAADALGDGRLRSAGLAAWHAFRQSFVDSRGRIAFSAPARVGWRYTPAELALALELIAAVRHADPRQADELGVLAAELVRTNLLAERVQLWVPLRYWQEHVGLPCYAAAPVFAVRIGPPNDEPVWTLRRP